MPTSPSQRRELRGDLAQRRRDLGPAERIGAAQGLRHSLESLPEFLTDGKVAGYWATGGELPLNLAIAGLTERGQQFYLPVIDSNRRLCFVPWRTGDEVAPNRLGIPEPVNQDHVSAPNQMDLVLVPLLGFDRKGNRLGFGGGYYDRSFDFLNVAERPAQPLLVGVGYSFQEVKSIETAHWDVRLDYIATEKELIDCTGGK
ncbi:5-formyltetrahydrofolate cyclo-ligase [Pinirhizobacter soli]|uniref:5-formyltetrahydrofolate cyclo-ligase n=1 Tax=Pinirhizobacter soli TaxID=2786953 RepID=UPI00202A9B8C|nr:5-formyltetrahydrofolate cyclo-ligase [Pinirhizobacter soli]